jgi:hypothetical protein
VRDRRLLWREETYEGWQTLHLKMCKNGKRNSAKYPSERTSSHAIP